MTLKIVTNSRLVWSLLLSTSIGLVVGWIFKTKSDDLLRVEFLGIDQAGKYSRSLVAERYSLQYE